MKAIISIIIFLLSTSIYCSAWNIDPTYYNTNSSNTVNNHFGLSTKINTTPLSFTTGIDYIKFNSYGTIHSPAGDIIVTEQTYLSVPVGIHIEKKVKKINILASIGYRFYINQSINNNKVRSIEDIETITGSSLVSNYSEEIQPHIYISIGMKFRVIKHLNIQVNKTWATIKNKITYTYLDSYAKEKESEFDYEPISISAQIYF